MTFLGVGLAVLGALVVGALLLFLLGPPYRKLFADAHLVELCETLDRIRAAACRRVERPTKPFTAPDADEIRSDDRIAVSTAGLRLAYTVTEVEGEPDFLSHHVSLSHPSGLTAESAGRFLSGLVLARCSVPPDAAYVRRSQNLVVHVMFQVDRAHLAEFAAHVLPIPRKEEIRGLRRLASESGQAVDFAEFEVPSPVPGREPRRKLRR